MRSTLRPVASERIVAFARAGKPPCRPNSLVSEAVPDDAGKGQVFSNGI